MIFSKMLFHFTFNLRTFAQNLHSNELMLPWSFLLCFLKQLVIEDMFAQELYLFLMQGTFVRRAEVLFSANYFGFDDVVTSDGERISDRICAIPFQDLPDMSPAEYVSRQKKFKTVIDSEEKPMEFVIGETGNFILSEEFMTKRTEFSELLMNMCEELIYPRTLLTNYASFYTITWKLYTIFEDVFFV